MEIYYHQNRSVDLPSDYVTLSTGYYKDIFRITYSATAYGKSMESCDTGAGYSEPVDTTEEESTLSDGTRAVKVTAATTNHTSITLHYARNDILYRIHVTGPINDTGLTDMADEIISRL